MTFGKRVNSYIKLMLLERGIEILDGLIPKMVIDINIIDSKVEEVSSFSFSYLYMVILYQRKNVINPFRNLN